MKKTILTGALLLLLTPFLAQASCESVRDDIARKIIANGVPESGFELDIVPNDQVSQHGGQVVGHCEQDTQKIVYIRLSDDNDMLSQPTSPAGKSR
ncbi:DUF1161 domain-containing protein [Dickeya dadantii]|uniref:DUF1161 domain-containing protein n=1 Tax=Dickeya dadantii TaxID=204038 RepID=UPI00039A8C13|nr:DUF1161 domain-containing protein [Dickeya dadantii]NPE49940.1 DUF1161 domain-containing protein [Dickeya dadantii]NPE53676.1 DUF1161 domain-containing protein [Dickeya dadantii]NPE67055.1 DUF1161 domain-containing protein [Dickeya dadantii]